MHTIIDTEALATELRAQVRGEVRFDEGSRVLNATDSSNYRQVPIGVVIPWDADDVKRAVAACRLYSAPILARGAGTSLAGQCCNVAVLPLFLLVHQEDHNDRRIKTRSIPC